MILRLIRGLLLVAVCAGPSLAQTRAPVSDSAVQITLLTMGQGGQVYELFGHNAIWVRDPVTGIDSVYNWGVFDFRSEGFLVRFLQGDMRYTMDSQTMDYTLRYYRYFNRRIWAQELDLTPAEKRAVVDYIQWNSRPENRQYRYNYYLDNCSTRVRDILDRAVGGQLRTYLRTIPTDETYRSHSLRLMQSTPLLVTGVEMALGRSTDIPLNADQASFLPVEMMGYLRNFKLDGGKRPFVAREFMLSDAERGPEPAAAPALWKALLPIGLGLAALVLVLWFGLHSRVATATVVAVLAGVIGIVGLIIFLLVTVTDHVAAHGNENMWMLNPIWLVVAVALPIALFKRRWKVARWATIAGAVVALGAVLMHLGGMSRQSNWDVIALLLPIQLAMAALVLREAKKGVSAPPRSA